MFWACHPTFYFTRLHPILGFSFDLTPTFLTGLLPPSHIFELLASGLCQTVPISTGLWLLYQVHVPNLLFFRTFFLVCIWYICTSPRRKDHIFWTACFLCFSYSSSFWVLFGILILFWDGNLAGTQHEAIDLAERWFQGKPQKQGKWHCHQVRNSVSSKTILAWKGVENVYFHWEACFSHFFEIFWPLGLH